MHPLVLAAALAAAVPSVPPPDPGAGSLTGRVTNPAGTPLAEVRVTILEANRSATTDAEGRYVIPNLANGTYGVAFALVGFAPQVRRVTIRDAEVTLDVILQPSTVELPPIQVTATPLATTALTSPQPTSIVSGAELEQTHAPSLGQTLQHLAGLRNYSTGQGIGKPVIRGLTSNRILVLADGQRIEGQQWGDEHAPSVETADADRIEVIRGPASVLYGSDAIGGVINVVARELPDAVGRRPFLDGSFTAAYTSNGDAPEGTVLLEGAAGGLGFRTSFSGRTSEDLSTPDGVLFNSGARTLNGTGALGLRGDWGSASIAFTRRDERVEIHEDPADDPGATPFQRIGTSRAAFTLNVPVGAARLEVDAGYERSRRREFEEAGATQVALGLLEQTVTANAHYHHAALGPVAGIVGASYLRSELEKFGEETLVPENRVDAVGIYAFEQAELGRWHLSLGLRYDHRRLDVSDDAELGVAAQHRSYNSLTGNVGVLYRLAEPLALVVNVGRGYRAPSPFDLFANGVHEGTRRFERGNPELTNETSLNTDLGLRIQTDRLSAELGGFVNFIDDYIFPDPTGEVDPESGLQVYDIVQGNARIAGLEASAELHLSPSIHFRTTADYTHGQNTTTDRPLPFIPPFRVTYGVRLEGPRIGIVEGPYLTLGGETNARQTRPDPEDFAPPGYSIFSVGGGFSVATGRSRVAFDLQVRNLFDEAYAGFLSRYKTYALDPGRTVVVRVGTQF
ncbi:MAG TPA: TonB-dependent receptor [Gemmatimonadales bacterium]|nr:TonB-dependent receptor [Gemmatimonadales bacterium]